MKVLSVDFTASNAAEQFCLSLKETGFAVLNNHPIPVNLLYRAQEEWKNFFYSNAKHDYVYQKPAQDGYFPFRTESAKDRKVSDLKEFFHYYPWGKVPEETKEISTLMFTHLKILAAELLQWIENTLPEMIKNSLSIPLKNMISDSPNTLLRILHYPPLTDVPEDGAVRAAAHEDINLITLLPAATAPGLQAKDLHGKWHAVDCNPNSIVVNVGDMLQLCTQSYYKSTTHRVVNPSGADANVSRFSMPLFLHPNGGVLLSETQTASEYLHQRLREIGIY
ncbi:MAG: 2OG-Fe(II) oxygenase family protein [Gammaproteobacteria bacterium]|nr:2OG-Fe(II) oxygenase family protein [Gammaproteobacteria bacterium]